LGNAVGKGLTDVAERDFQPGLKNNVDLALMQESFDHAGTRLPKFFLNHVYFGTQ
jgi:hypothetical protein